MPCWAAIGGVDAAGAAVCRPGCDYGRRARAGCPLPAHELYVRRTDGGRRRVRASMIALPETGGGGYAIVMQDQHDPAGPADPGGGRLTPRQREVLTLIAEGLPVRAVALRLGLSEATVRNYVRRILLCLGCHSQLEAVAAARRTGLIPGP
jgi:DNA-binding CsgD family transcriptional regulator